MTDTWLKAINEGKLVGCAMIDFRKAFDLVDHKLLLNKLDIYRFSALSLTWFQSYLSNRAQQVKINKLIIYMKSINYFKEQKKLRKD